MASLQPRHCNRVLPGPGIRPTRRWVSGSTATSHSLGHGGPHAPRPPLLGCHRCCVPLAAEGNGYACRIAEFECPQKSWKSNCPYGRSSYKVVTLNAYNDCHNSYKAHGPIPNNNTVTVKAMETCSLFHRFTPTRVYLAIP